MNAKTVAKVSAVIFGLIALVHLIRVIVRFDAVIAGWAVPLWLSIVAFLAAGWLAWQNWKAGK